MIWHTDQYNERIKKVREIKECLAKENINI